MKKATKKQETLINYMVKELSESNVKSLEFLNEGLSKPLFKQNNYSVDFFINEEGNICCTNNRGHDTFDYYGEYRGGYPWVNPILEKIANEKNLYWEWQDPSCIILYKK